MKIEASSPQGYVENVPAHQKNAFIRLRHTILSHLPDGFEETINYGMIGYVVPLSTYPSGYRDPEKPLPFINMGCQKNYISLYHSGLYADRDLLDWFRNAYPNHSRVKLNMGKSCIRFRNGSEIPYELIGQLISRVTPAQWVKKYEEAIKGK